MPFHRLTVPTYDGGLPSSHDYINNAGVGTPAPVSAQQSGGTYDGTYFEVPGETAESTKVNRANSALAENCDFIDDVLLTSRPVLTYEDFTAGGGGDTQIQLTGDVFVGRAGVAPINQEERDFLIAIVDPLTLQQLVIGPLVTPEVVSCSDLRDSGDAANVIGTEATGYHTNPIVVFSVTIPAATDYRVVYLRRSTVVAESDPDDATGDMGYLVGYLVKALGRGAAAASKFVGGETAWHNGSDLSGQVTVQEAIDQIIGDLGSDGAGTRGAVKVGATGYVGTGLTLTIGSVESQLQELADGCGGLNTANTWLDLNTFDAGLEVNNSAAVFTAGIELAGSPNIISTASAPWRIGAGGQWQWLSSGDVVLMALHEDGSGLELHNIPLKLGSLSNIEWSTHSGDVTSERSITISDYGTPGAQTKGTGILMKAQRGREVSGGANNSDGGDCYISGGQAGEGGSGTAAEAGKCGFRFEDDSGNLARWNYGGGIVRAIPSFPSDYYTGPSMTDDEYHYIRAVMIAFDGAGGFGYVMHKHTAVVKRVSGTVTVEYDNLDTQDGTGATVFSVAVNGTTGWKVTISASPGPSSAQVVVFLEWMASAPGLIN